MILLRENTSTFFVFSFNYTFSKIILSIIIFATPRTFARITKDTFKLIAKRFKVILEKTKRSYVLFLKHDIFYGVLTEFRWRCPKNRNVSVFTIELTLRTGHLYFVSHISFTIPWTPASTIPRNSDWIFRLQYLQVKPFFIKTSNLQLLLLLKDPPRPQTPGR